LENRRVSNWLKLKVKKADSNLAGNEDSAHRREFNVDDIIIVDDSGIHKGTKFNFLNKNLRLMLFYIYLFIILL